MSPLPFLKAAGDAPVAWRAGHPVTATQFCAHVAKLAADLPDGRYAVNVCDDRYLFLVALAAAMTRGHVSLLPPGRAPQMLADIADHHDGSYFLTDGIDCPGTQPRIDCRAAIETAVVTPTENPAAVPAFPTEQDAIVAFTSGTTGIPEPHAKTWGSLVKNAEIAARRLVPDSFAAGGVLVGTVPHQHMYGLESTIMMPLQAGIAIHSGRPLYPKDLRDALSDVPAPRMVITTPIHLRSYLTEGVTMPDLAMVVSATAPLSSALATDVEAFLGCPVYEIYGCTEAGAIATRRTVQTAIWRTYDGIALSRDGDRATVRGGHLDGVAVLSDVIDILSPEAFELCGRDGDMVNIAGKRTSLAYLNHHLSQIDGVTDGIFFMPDAADDRNARLAAMVVAPGLSAPDILRALRRQLDTAFLPRPLLLVDTLPRTESGKLPRAMLLERYKSALPASRS